MSDLEGRLALIIEDDETGIAVLEQLLYHNGVQSVVIADSFKVAEDLENVAVPDVIFLDLEMPQSNGYTVLEYIRRNAKFDGIPVIAYTTHTSHLNEAQQAGFDGFLGKPIDGSQFRKNLIDILSGVPVWEVP